MEDIRLRAEIDDADNIYPSLRKELFTKEFFKTNIEIFTVSLLLGKYMIGKRQTLRTSKEFIRIESIENKDEMDILKCVAIDETNNVNIISNYKEIFNICEEYANCGIKKLYSWTNDKEDFKTKLSTFLLEVFEKNSEIYKKYNE